jgi:plastocyanin
VKLSAAVLGLASILALGPPASNGGSAAPARSASHVQSLASLFRENPFTGGQVAPRSYRWATERSTIFVQFDRPTTPRTLRYVGISVKSTFCAETQPGGANGGFTHFHRIDSPTYAAGHGGPPGSQGYWLLWAAVDEFAAGDGREIKPGVDYGFSPTPPPACGSSPAPTFAGPGAHRLTPTEIRQLAAQFTDNPFRGRQTAPRLYRWVSADTLAFLEFDKPDPKKARSLRYIGVAQRGTFCTTGRSHTDFTYFHRLRAASYAKGRGGKAGETGFWHLAIAVDDFRRPWGNVTAGVDRRYNATAPPACGASAGPVAAEIRTGAGPDAQRPFAFQPPEVRVTAGSTVRWTNADGVFHTVTSSASPERRQPSGLFDRTLATRGQAFEFKFDRPGTFHFYCQPHSEFMAGTVLVT